jgi:hypothetical protein
MIVRKKKIEIKQTVNIFSNQKGMALLTTLIFVFVLVTLSVALLTMTNNDSKLSTLQKESTRAFYLADAGIEEAFWKLNTNILEKKLNTESENIGDWWSLNWIPPGTANEYYDISVEETGSDADGNPLIKIISTGVVSGGKFSSGKRTVEVTAEIDYITEAMYDFAILTDHVILFQGDPGPDIVGDVHSNDTILVAPANGTFVENYPGNATSSGETNELNSENIGATPITIPEVNYESLRGKSDDLGNTIVVEGGNGKYVVSDSWGTEDNPISGIHFIDGGLEVKEGAEIWVENGAIIVTKDVEVKNGAVFEIHNDDSYINSDDPDTALALAAQGDIKIYAAANIEKGVVQSITDDGVSEGFIELKNGCTVTGSVIADTVYLRNKSTVDYPPSGFDDFTRKGDPFFKKTSWQEAY